MNDCVWAYIGVCECDEYKCERFVSANSGDGEEIITQYGREVEEELKPLKEKWEKIMEVWEID